MLQEKFFVRNGETVGWLDGETIDSRFRGNDKGLAGMTEQMEERRDWRVAAPCLFLLMVVLYEADNNVYDKLWYSVS